MKQFFSGFTVIRASFDFWLRLMCSDYSAPDFSGIKDGDYETAFKELDRYHGAKALKWGFFALINGPEILP